MYNSIKQIEKEIKENVMVMILEELSMKTSELYLTQNNIKIDEITNVLLSKINIDEIIQDALEKNFQNLMCDFLFDNLKGDKVDYFRRTQFYKKMSDLVLDIENYKNTPDEINQPCPCARCKKDRRLNAK